MNTTETKGSLYETGTVDGIAAWWLSIVHHSNADFIGLRAPITSDAPLELGREALHFGATVLEDRRISRRHARLKVDSEGVILTDLSSRNGTFVNGQRVQQATLDEGAVVGTGSILFLLHRAPLVYDEPNNKRLIGNSYALSRAITDAHKVATFPTAVLILGETGTGKELIANEIHLQSRRSGPLLSLNCGGMPDELLQSELFGHVRGAFSGADRDRKGMLEAASGGTVFLDEIGDSSPAFQVSLLRFLQEGEVRRIGANKTINVDTRVIAATNRDLTDMVKDGSFREDLYARLASWVISLAPLRERKQDIPLLAQYFKDAAGGRNKTLHHRLARRLLAYDWPRNIRELKSVIERAIIQAGTDPQIRLTPALESTLTARPESPAPKDKKVRTGPVVKPSSDELRNVLVEHNANIRQVSDALEVSRNTLYRWMKEYNIDLEHIREQLRSGAAE